MNTLVILRIAREIVKAYLAARSQPIPAAAQGNARAYRLFMAAQLVSIAMARLEQRFGLDIVNDAKFRAAVDLMMSGMGLLIESVADREPATDVRGAALGGL